MLSAHTAPALHPEAAAEQSALHARGTALKVHQRLSTVSSAERAGIEVCQQAATGPCALSTAARCRNSVHASSAITRMSLCAVEA